MLKKVTKVVIIDLHTFTASRVAKEWYNSAAASGWAG